MWMAGTNNKGYGKISEDAPSRKTFLAHRLSYELHNGPIPLGEGPYGTCVLHTCDNPLCVNPAHLFLGSYQENATDMVKKGRQARGEKQGLVKLTEEQVAEIRRDYIKSSHTHGQTALGRKYGVHQTAIWKVVNEKTWK